MDFPFAIFNTRLRCFLTFTSFAIISCIKKVIKQFKIKLVAHWSSSAGVLNNLRPRDNTAACFRVSWRFTQVWRRWSPTTASCRNFFRWLWTSIATTPPSRILTTTTRLCRTLRSWWRTWRSRGPAATWWRLQPQCLSMISWRKKKMSINDHLEVQSDSLDTQT